MVADAAVAQLDRYQSEDIEPSERETIQLHTGVAYIWDACSNAIETLFRASGASAISKRLPLQLIARNCRAGSRGDRCFVDSKVVEVVSTTSESSHAPIAPTLLSGPACRRCC